MPNPGAGVIHWIVNGVAAPDASLGSDGTARLDVVVQPGSNLISASFVADGYAPSAATLTVAAIAPVPAACAQVVSWNASQGASAADVAAGHLTLFGVSAGISPATFNPGTPPVSASSWAMWYRSLYWLVPTAVHAYLDGDAAASALVVAYVHGYDRLPDPGSATATARARANAVGWDEGTNLRREEALNCLVQLIPDAAVGRLLDASINANLDVNRYYGLPQRHPHNHGLMANIALMSSGSILGRPALVDRAAQRLTTDVAGVVDPGCGMVYEQSSAYQSTNISLWTIAARELVDHDRPAAAATVTSAVARMTSAYDLLVAPDGQLPPIGDGSPITGFRAATHPTTRLLCTATGWAAGRSAWSASAWYYALRFGPGQAFHGHADHGSVVWSTGGRDILVDPGSANDVHPTWAAYDHTEAAHSVLRASGVRFTGPTSLIRVARGSARDLYVVRDFGGGVTRTRSVRVDGSLPLLFVLDRARSTLPRTFTQTWHFSTRWHWNPTTHRLSDGSATAGIVSIDLVSRRAVGVTPGTALVFPNALMALRAPTISVTRSGVSASIFSVAYVSTNGAVPVLRWYPGWIAGTGRVRVWWGRTYRDVLIDATGIRA